MVRIFYFLSIVLIFAACEEPQKSVPVANESSPPIVVKASDLPTTFSDTFPQTLRYTWQPADWEPAFYLKKRFPSLEKDQIQATTSNSFAHWLQHLPLKAPNAPVYLYNGSLKGNQQAHLAVLDMDVGKRDLQQCADAVMRLRAEYLYSQQSFSKIHFNYTSGDKVSFEDWAKGRKPKVKGNRVVFSNASGNPDYSYANFRKYLIAIFNYAGTASLSKELIPVFIEDMQIGDVFIQGGFPGHAVIVVNMKENAQGEKFFMLAQSYMPAQEMHILKNPAEPNSPWYPLTFGVKLHTPEWPFSRKDLKRFR